MTTLPSSLRRGLSALSPLLRSPAFRNAPAMIITYTAPNQHASLAPTLAQARYYVRQSSPSSDGNWQAKLVIFDKDGTLIHFNSVWMPWVHTLAKSLETATGQQLINTLFERLGICNLTQRPRTGVFGQGTVAQIRGEVLNVLQERGVANPGQVLDQCWPECDNNSPETEQELEEIRPIFQQLRRDRVKIAICTSDTREHTLNALRNMKLLEYVQHIACGDDPGVSPKPDPSNVAMLCRAAGVEPKDSVVIGDAEADVQMGYRAGVGLNIGVLSGIGTRLELAQHADYVADNVFESMAIIGRVQKEPDHVPGVRRLQSDAPATADLPHDLPQDLESKAKLVIFDKDGTLICFHSMWTPWAKALIKRLEDATGMSLYDKTMRELGYCSKTDRWQPGILAEGTTGQNREKLMDILLEEGLKPEEAERALEHAWKDSDHSKGNKHLRVLDNPTALFKLLKDNAVKVAICTADTRRATKQFLASIDAEKYVDMLVCGDDPQTEPKPSPKNAFKICEALRVHPYHTVMVGDTIADVGMGVSAKLGASVGVLTGVGRVKDFVGKADHVVPSIKHLLRLIFPKSHPAFRKHTQQKAAEN